MADESTSNQTPAKIAGVPTTIPVGPGGQLDISWLPEDQRQALLTDHARKVLNIQEKALEMGVEASVLRNTLDTLSDTTQKVAEDGNSVTLKHEHKTSTGRTEAVMGNTGEAAKGQLLFGGDMRTLYVVGGLVVAVVVIVLLFR